MQSTAEVATTTDPAPAAIPLNLFAQVPATTLPNGLLVPSFEVGQYLCSRGVAGLAAITREGKPWVSINYADSRAACEAAGYALITETQALALAVHIAQQPTNWSGGAVGEGELYAGLRKGKVRSAQAGTYESKDAAERRWFELANGERIFDVAGNAYTWVVDDVQGDDKGLIAKAFAADSPSITSAPFPSRQKGVGWYPDAGDDWSGDALIRGGYWDSDSNAGVFGLLNGWPGNALDYVGFRCTKPSGR